MAIQADHEAKPEALADAVEKFRTRGQTLGDLIRVGGLANLILTLRFAGIEFRSVKISAGGELLLTAFDCMDLSCGEYLGKTLEEAVLNCVKSKGLDSTYGIPCRLPV